MSNGFIRQVWLSPPSYATTSSQTPDRYKSRIKAKYHQWSVKSEPFTSPYKSSPQPGRTMSAGSGNTKDATIMRVSDMMTTVEQVKWRMEQIRLSMAEKKLHLLSTQTKNDELNYRANLVNQYMLWKQQGMTDKQILRIYPDTKVVIDALKEGVE